jgi:hypothetical protein
MIAGVQASRSSIVFVLGLTLACTEKNPYALLETGGDDSTTGDPIETGNETETGDPPGCGDPACELTLQVVEFTLQGNDTFTAEIPKPAQQESVPIGAVHRYEPGQSETLGYSILWADYGDSWGLEVTTTGAANNSRISGVGVVIGLGADFPAPDMHALDIGGPEGCGNLESTALAGRFWVDTVERYEPGEAATVFEFSRSVTLGETVDIEYCVTQPDSIDSFFGAKLVVFDVPEGALAVTAEATLDSGSGAMQSFASLGSVDQIVHLLGARTLSEAAAPGLGWQASCNGAPPYTCSYNLSGFSAGASVELAGAVLAIQ